jgi:hypothetical protein
MASIFIIISFDPWFSFVSCDEACETSPHESGIRINLSTVQFQCYLTDACVRARRSQTATMVVDPLIRMSQNYFRIAGK